MSYVSLKTEIPCDRRCSGIDKTISLKLTALGHVLTYYLHKIKRLY